MLTFFVQTFPMSVTLGLMCWDTPSRLMPLSLSSPPTVLTLPLSLFVHPVPLESRHCDGTYYDGTPRDRNVLQVTVLPGEYLWHLRPTGTTPTTCHYLPSHTYHPGTPTPFRDVES